MIVLHDGANTDLSHIQAIASIEEGFGLFDYVRISQRDNMAWIGQIVEPNRNISTVGQRLDPTILHGLELMQSSPNVQSTASVQVFDILVLGQFDGRHMLTPRLRPMPGAIVERLQRDDTLTVIGIPRYEPQLDSNNQVIESNVIGMLLNADSVPLCFSDHLFNYHVMLAGGTGSGKSNAAANLVWQATRAGKCVLVHDAKPDYGMVNEANTDPNVAAIWEHFAQHGLLPRSASPVTKIGFFGRCNPSDVDRVVGFRASDFAPAMLAALMFPDSAEQNQFEAFAGAAHTLSEQVQDPSNNRSSYSLDDILTLVENRMRPNTPPREQVNDMTGRAILRKAASRRRQMPWLDVIGRRITGANQGSRLQASRLDNGFPTVQEFNLAQQIRRGGVIVIDYSQMDEESYALILSYFLRVSQTYRRSRGEIGIVQLVDEAHRIFDNESRHSASLSRAFSRVMREGRSVDHSIILSLQNASQIPSRVMNNLNTQIVMRQNSKGEADSATQTMGRDFSVQSMRLGTGHALVSIHESRAVVLAQLAPSPYELMRNDNTGRSRGNLPQITPDENTAPSVDDDIPF